MKPVMIIALLSLFMGCSSTSQGLEISSRKEFLSIPYKKGMGLSVRVTSGAIFVFAQKGAKKINVISTITAVGETQAIADQRNADMRVSFKVSDAGDLLVWCNNKAKSTRWQDHTTLQIIVPESRSTRLVTRNGSVEVAGLTGPLVIRDTLGSIVIGHSGSLDIKSTGSTDINVIGHTGSAKIKAQYDIHISTSPSSQGPYLVESNYGHIRLKASKSLRGQVFLSSHNRLVLMGVPPKEELPTEKIKGDRYYVHDTGLPGERTVLVSRARSKRIVFNQKE